MNAALITLSAGIVAGLLGILIRHILKKVVLPFQQECHSQGEK